MTHDQVLSLLTLGAAGIGWAVLCYVERPPR